MENNTKLTVLVVDDTPTNIDIVKGVLSKSYLVQAAVNGSMALRILSKKKPDIILLDVMMPEMDGYEVCRQIKSQDNLKDIPIIFLTAKSEIDDEIKGLSLGAVDYITKPISPVILEKRVENHLELVNSRNALKKQNEILEKKVGERTQQMEELQDVTMVAMGALAESRDPDTGNHIRRTQHFVRLLANKLKNHPRFSSFLTPENITLIFKSAPLHDIGKVGVSDKILLKPGKLTIEEFDEVKLHTRYGRDAIVSAEKLIKKSPNFLIYVKEIAYYHHEKWDGTGYPEGLKGDEIPISARLMALADVYDALVSRRVYKAPFSHNEAIEIISEDRGTHFDPDIVDAFLAISDDFKLISDTYED